MVVVAAADQLAAAQLVVGLHSAVVTAQAAASAPAVSAVPAAADPAAAPAAAQPAAVAVAAFAAVQCALPYDSVFVLDKRFQADCAAVLVAESGDQFARSCCTRVNYQYIITALAQNQFNQDVTQPQAAVRPFCSKVVFELPASCQPGTMTENPAPFLTVDFLRGVKGNYAVPCCHKCASPGLG